MEPAYDMTLMDFMSWVKTHQKQVSKLFPGERALHRQKLQADAEFFKGLPESFHKHGLHECFVWDVEFGFKDALVLIPPTCLGRWRRYNNDVDWAEDTQLHGQQNRLVRLERELHPWPKGAPPVIVAALLVWAGIPEVWEALEELCVRL